MAERSNRSFAVIGLGTFGSTIANELVRFGNHVLGVDHDERMVRRMADTLSEAIIAEGTDEDALREAGVGQYDVAVVAIGEDLEASILCTMHLKVLGVPCIWVKAISRTHHRILTRIGADRVLQPEQEIGRHVAQVLHNPLIRDYVSLGNGFYVVDFQVPEKFDGKSLGEVGRLDRFEIVALGLMRGTEFHPCHEALRLEEDDKLLLLGRRPKLREFGDSL